jgi:hypothetical protein
MRLGSIKAFTPSRSGFDPRFAANQSAERAEPDKSGRQCDSCDGEQDPSDSAISKYRYADRSQHQSQQTPPAALPDWQVLDVKHIRAPQFSFAMIHRGGIARKGFAPRRLFVRGGSDGAPLSRNGATLTGEKNQKAANRFGGLAALAKRFATEI